MYQNSVDRSGPCSISLRMPLKAALVRSHAPDAWALRCERGHTLAKDPTGFGSALGDVVWPLALRRGSVGSGKVFMHNYASGAGGGAAGSGPLRLGYPGQTGAAACLKVAGLFAPSSATLASHPGATHETQVSELEPAPEGPADSDKGGR